MNNLESRVTNVEERLSKLEIQTKALEIQVDSIQEDVQVLNKTLADLCVKIENEVVFGIRVIGDGHADFNRKLREAEADRDEREKLLLRLVRVESDILRINKRCAHCA